MGEQNGTVVSKQALRKRNEGLDTPKHPPKTVTKRARVMSHHSKHKIRNVHFHHHPLPSSFTSIQGYSDTIPFENYVGNLTVFLGSSTTELCFETSCSGGQMYKHTAGRPIT